MFYGRCTVIFYAKQIFTNVFRDSSKSKLPRQFTGSVLTGKNPPLFLWTMIRACVCAGIQAHATYFNLFSIRIMSIPARWSISLGIGNYQRNQSLARATP